VELMFELLSPPAPDWLRALADANTRGDPAVLATATNVDTAQRHVAHPVGREPALPDGLRDEVRRLLRETTDNAISVIETDGTTWWLQRVAETRRPVMLFGAGHVGKAVPLAPRRISPY
jgi:hypothetical protein